jgi:hypothetical protein
MRCRSSPLLSAFRNPKSAIGVPMAGFEPARACLAQRILSPLRLPFRHIGEDGETLRERRRKPIVFASSGVAQVFAKKAQSIGSSGFTAVLGFSR